MQYNPTVIECPVMHSWTPNFTNDFISDSRFQNISDYVPRMENSIILAIMIITAVATGLELSPHPHVAAKRYTLFNRFHYFVVVVGKINRIVV